jgi:hypothetical protein
MAIDVHLVERTVDGGDFVIDGIEAVLIAIDDTVETTSALIQAAAVDQVNVVLGAGKLPTGYFDTNRFIGVGTGTWDADDDITIFSGKNVSELIA